MNAAEMSETQPENIASLAREGGVAALFERHRPELLRFLAARCGNPEEAEDLMQEMWLKLASLSHGPVANGRAYLFRMANNLVLDTIRGRHRAMARDRGWLVDMGGGEAPPEDRRDPAVAADEAIAAAEEVEMLRAAIERLPAGAARALRLHRLEGLNQREVAQAMGISRSGVEKHLATAMKHLRQALNDCGVFAPAASFGQDKASEGETQRGGDQ